MALEDLRAKLDALRKSRAGGAPTPDGATADSDMMGATGNVSPQDIIESENGGGAEPSAEPSAEPMPTEPMGSAPPPTPPTPSYLTQENFNQDFGQWFGNDSGLGEELFRQMNIMGVDTKAATEAALRNVLEDVVNRSRAVMQQLSYFISNIMQQTNQMAQMSAAVNNALAMKGEPIPQVDIGNPPPEEPPMDMGGGEPPADMGGGEPPADMGGGEEPPPEEPSADEGTPSDSRIKNVATGKYVVSDAQAKNIFRQLKSYSNNGSRKQRENILSAVRTGFN